MHEHQAILNKIEQLVDKLPYTSVRIEVELKNETLILEKNRPAKCGFLDSE